MKGRDDDEVNQGSGNKTDLLGQIKQLDAKAAA